jgi:hypothetical protein
VQYGVAVLHPPIAPAADQLAAIEQRGADRQTAFMVARKSLLEGDEKTRVGGRGGFEHGANDSKGIGRNRVCAPAARGVA